MDQQSPLQPAPIQPAPQPAEAGRVKAFAPSAKRAGSARLLNVVLGLAVVLAIGGVAFAAGRLTAPAPTNPFGAGGPGQFNGGNRGTNGQGGPGGFLGGGGGITLEGTVESVSGTTLTLKTANGQTIQIALNGSTTYHAQSDASASEVTTGGTVRVEVSGFRGGGPGASFNPNGGATSQTASDVTVVP